MSRVPVARALRKRSTEAEKLLWRHLRSRQLAGLKFRRQEPIGPYIVDFYCLAHRLIVEVDGGQHAVDQERDRERTAWLEARGHRVIRVWNAEVIDNIEGVLATIVRRLEETKSPSPSHR